MVPWVGLQFVNVVFPDHIYLLVVRIHDVHVGCRCEDQTLDRGTYVSSGG